MLGLVLIAKPRRRLEPWQSLCNGSHLGPGKEQASETAGLLHQQVFGHYHPALFVVLIWSADLAQPAQMLPLSEVAAWHLFFSWIYVGRERATFLSQKSQASRLHYCNGPCACLSIHACSSSCAICVLGSALQNHSKEPVISCLSPLVLHLLVQSLYSLQAMLLLHSAPASRRAWGTGGPCAQVLNGHVLPLGVGWGLWPWDHCKQDRGCVVSALLGQL